MDEEFEEEVPQDSVTVWRINNVETNNMWGALKEEDEVVAINEVEVKKKRCTVTMDSGAGASCLPKDWMPGVPLKPRKKGVKFVAAEGSDMGYYGRKDVRFRAVRSEGGKTRDAGADGVPRDQLEQGVGFGGGHHGRGEHDHSVEEEGRERDHQR